MRNDGAVPVHDSSALTVVVLAAGLGTRFGGLKQLAPVGPDGEAIVDALLRRAAAAGFTDAVVIVRPEIEAAVRAHLAARPVAALRLTFVVQQPVAGRDRPPGTAHAVLATRDVIDGSFAVVNADDLYPHDAFTLLAAQLRSAPPSEHALVAFPVGRTLVSTERPVKRALVDFGDTRRLVAIREGVVAGGPDGLRFDHDGRSTTLRGDEWVSMNMFGFRASIFATLDAAVAAHLGAQRPGEILLPDVVAGHLDDSAMVVRVVACDAPCIGITHADDVAAVAAAFT
jgi:nucleotidyltransferase-like protein